MSPTDYLGASANPATNYLSDPFSFQTDMLDMGDQVIGAVFAEDEQAFGLVPGYGKEGVAEGLDLSKLVTKQQYTSGNTPAVKAAVTAQQYASGNTPAVKAAVTALHAAKRNAKALRGSALLQPVAAPRLKKAAHMQDQKAGAIQQALKTSWMRRQRLLKGVGADTVAAVEGAGDLQFAVASPPGIGRLTRIPFQIQGAVTAGTLSMLGDQPVVVPAGTAPNNQLLQTPQLPWSIVRLVAIEVQVTIDAPGAAAPDVYFVQNLQTGNAASLFGAAGVQPVNFYLQGLELRGGLRDYPIVRAPNFLNCTVSWVNSLLVNDPTTAGTTIVCVEAVVDVLADDDFGAHLPGPYARPEALIRKPVGRI